MFLVTRLIRVLENAGEYIKMQWVKNEKIPYSKPYISCDGACWWQGRGATDHTNTKLLYMLASLVRAIPFILKKIQWRYSPTGPWPTELLYYYYCYCILKIILLFWIVWATLLSSLQPLHTPRVQECSIISKAVLERCMGGSAYKILILSLLLILQLSCMSQETCLW